MAVPYRYRPLESVRHVRVLIANWPEERYPHLGNLSYSINHGSIDQMWSYAAVSYAWGPNHRSEHLVLNDGSYVLITASLKTALREITAHAHADGLDHVWIDQICINQDDIREREQQVKLMREVYQKSSTALVWLGGEDKHTQDLVELFKAEQKGLESAEDERGKKQYKIEARERAVRQLLSPYDASGCRLTPHELSFLKFFDRPWFQRAWAFQEAILPCVIKFCIGSHSFPHHFIPSIALSIGSYRLGRMLLEARRVNPSAAAGYEILLAIVDAREDHAQGRRFHDHYCRDYQYFLCEVAHRCKTSNMRDLCFAFLGLKNDWRITINPDYGVSVSMVFVNTTRSIIAGTSSLDIFTSLNRGESKAALSDLPSWVPDWSAEPTAVPLYATNTRMLFESSGFHSLFSASGRYAYHSVSRERELRVCGKVIDTISWIRGRHADVPLPQRISEADICGLFELEETLDDLQQIWPSRAGKLTQERLLAVLIAEGANTSDTEIIFQHEALRGLAKWRLSELVQTYRSWLNIQANISKAGMHEALLDARALLAYGQVARNRRVFATAEWRLGLAPREAQKDDIVCILHGSKTPVILRRRLEGGLRVVGQCYLEGVMRGEAISWEQNKADEFILA